MDRIIAGFGVHAQSTAALEWAARLARRTDANLEVVNVFHPAYAEMAPSTHEELRSERRTLVEHALGSTDDLKHEVIVLEGEAVEELVRHAHAVQADLIVVGRHESMAPWGFGEHGASEGLLRHSDIPFAVVGDKAHLLREDGQLTIVVGVDGSEANADSLTAIGRLAHELGARLVPVFAVDTGASTSREAQGSKLVHQDRAEAVAASLPGADPLRIVNEKPVEGLLAAARDVGADFVAVGTRGHRSLVDLFAGQSVRHLIDHADVAVLVAPHSHGQGAQR